MRRAAGLILDDATKDTLGERGGLPVGWAFRVEPLRGLAVASARGLPLGRAAPAMRQKPFPAAIHIGAPHNRPRLYRVLAQSPEGRDSLQLSRHAS
jgi:hypothetical protein